MNPFTVSVIKEKKVCRSPVPSRVGLSNLNYKRTKKRGRKANKNLLTYLSSLVAPERLLYRDRYLVYSPIQHQGESGRLSGSGVLSEATRRVIS